MPASIRVLFLYFIALIAGFIPAMIIARIFIDYAVAPYISAGLAFLIIMKMISVFFGEKLGEKQ